MTNGILYAATGKSYINEAVQSAKSLKEKTDTNAAIVTTSSHSAQIDEEGGVFDDVIIIGESNEALGFRVRSLAKSPYKKTIHLDTDTLITDDIYPVFDLLDRVDIAAAREQAGRSITIDGVPNSFPEFNTGVIAYKDTDETSDFLNEWLRFWKLQMEQGRPGERMPGREYNKLEDNPHGRAFDQPPFREALYHSNLNLSVLPQEYNYRAYPGSFAWDEVKIIHNRPLGSEIKPFINECLGHRVFWGGKLLRRNCKDVRIIPLRVIVANSAKRKLATYLDKVGLGDLASDIYGRIFN